MKNIYFKISLCFLGLTFLAISGCKWKSQNTENEIVNSEPIVPDSNIIPAKDTTGLIKNDNTKSKKSLSDTIKVIQALYGIRPNNYKEIKEDQGNASHKKDSVVKKHKKPDPMEPAPAYGIYPDIYIDQEKNK